MLLASVSIAAQNTLEERTRCRDTCGPKLDCAKTCLFCYDCIRNGKKLDASSAKALQCKTECARHYDAALDVFDPVLVIVNVGQTVASVQALHSSGALPSTKKAA
ncbi:unnamed protein product [Tilletia controversa]|nr:unnamed protein product [Tilletia controversa]